MHHWSVSGVKIKYIETVLNKKSKNGHKCVIFIISFMSCKTSSCPSNIQIHQLNIHAEVQKKITLHQTAHTFKKMIGWLPQWKYYPCTQVTNTRVDGIHYEQITLNSRWTVHFYIKYIGLALFSFCNIHLLKQEDSSIQWFSKLKT